MSDPIDDRLEYPEDEILDSGAYEAPLIAALLPLQCAAVLRHLLVCHANASVLSSSIVCRAMSYCRFDSMRSGDRSARRCSTRMSHIAAGVSRVWTVLSPDRTFPPASYT